MSANMNEQDIARVKKLYRIIIKQKIGNDPSGGQRRVEIIRELERLCKTRFFSTKDFHFKIRKFLNNTT